MPRLPFVVVAGIVAVGAACGDAHPPPARDLYDIDGGGDYVTAPHPGGGGVPSTDPDCAYPAPLVDDGFCRPGPDDEDGDGYTVANGDCDDHDCMVNPGAFDIPGNGKDDDCNGVVDDEPTDCDGAVAIDARDALDGARALGLCRTTTVAAIGKARTWGVIDAAWTLPDRSPEIDPLSHGALPKLGATTPRNGATMLALSSGTARAPDQPGYRDVSGYDKGYTNRTPAGYPKSSPACPGVETGGARDGAAYSMVVRVPTNARSFHIAQNFFTFEYPDYICSPFNDFYVVMMSPAPPGLPDGNIAFDKAGNTISVNNGLLQACTPGTAGGKKFDCPLGTQSLLGTGFGDHAATGWITTEAPVVRGSQITLVLAIWDTTDGVLDSTVLVDDFRWSTEQRSCTKTVR